MVTAELVKDFIDTQPWRGMVADPNLHENKFLATLVALHFTPVSESVGSSFGLA